VRAAVAGAKARLSAERRDGTVPPKGWGHLDGVELAVRGTAGGGARRVQIARARLRDWSPAVERRFLDALGATCNVKAAIAEVGKSKGSAYGHRRRWPAFAKAWDQALHEAYAALENALMVNGANLFSTPDYVPETVIRDMRVDDAIHLLHMHKHKVHGSIENKVRAIIRARDLKEGELERRERDHAARRGER
jgi:hypothetical protein